MGPEARRVVVGVIVEGNSEWFFLPTLVDDDGAARRERAPLWEIDQHGRMPRNSGERSFRLFIHARSRLQQPNRVRHLRVVKYRRHIGVFDRAAGIHNQHIVGSLSDDAHIVRDHDRRSACLPPRHFDQVQNLRLDGDVQSGGGLVGNKYAWIISDRNGDDDTLTHTTGKLMRKGLHTLVWLRNADHIE